MILIESIQHSCFAFCEEGSLQENQFTLEIIRNICVLVTAKIGC